MGTIEHNVVQVDPLTDIEMTAIELKYEGHNYKEIAKQLEKDHTAVRKWFAKGGKLHEAYKIFATEETQARKEDAKDTFKAHLNNAVRTLVHVMNKSRLDIARVQAAKEIINRQLGEPLKIVAAVDEVKVTEYLEAAKQIIDNEKKIQGDDTGREDSNNLPVTQ